MHTIFTALASIAQKIGNAVKRFCIGIKNALVVVFRPIAHVLFLLLKGIYTIFKCFLLYLFYKAYSIFISSYSSAHWKRPKIYLCENL